MNLVDTLKGKSIDVSVFFREGDDPEHFCGGRNKVAFSPACYRQLQKIRPEVIHSQETWYCLLPGVLYKKLHGCTLVHTFYTEPVRKLPLPGMIFFHPEPPERLRLRDLRLEAVAGAGCRGRWPLVHEDCDHLCGGEVSDDEVEHFRKPYGIGDDTVVLLAIGMTAHPLKAEGLKLLIRAVRILRETYPDIVLIATREREYSEELKAFTRLSR